MRVNQFTRRSLEDQLEYYIAPYNQYKMLNKNMTFSDTSSNSGKSSIHSSSSDNSRAEKEIKFAMSPAKTSKRN